MVFYQKERRQNCGYIRACHQTEEISTDPCTAKDNNPKSSSEMKLSLIFLSALVVISHQQFQHPRGMRWMPYSPSQFYLNEYQPQFYDNSEDYSPFYRHFRPTRPVNYPQNEDLSVGLIAAQDNAEGEDIPDTQARYKGSNRYYHNQQQNPRFFYLGNSFTNPLLRTATFTLTSLVNLTSIQTCVPAAQFAANAPNCRRKREVLEDPLDDESDDIQFSISPSETLKVMPTNLASLEQILREKRQALTDQDLQRLISSKDEVTVDDVSDMQRNTRQKRFLLNGYAATTTVTTYSFVSTVVTKTVNLVAVADNGKVLCKPAGVILC